MLRRCCDGYQKIMEGVKAGLSWEGGMRSRTNQQRPLRGRDSASGLGNIKVAASEDAREMLVH